MEETHYVIYKKVIASTHTRKPSEHWHDFDFISWEKYNPWGVGRTPQCWLEGWVGNRVWYGTLGQMNRVWGRVQVIVGRSGTEILGGGNWSLKSLRWTGPSGPPINSDHKNSNSCHEWMLWCITGLVSSYLHSIFTTTQWGSWACLVVQMVKNPPAVQESQVPPLGWEDPQEEGMATTPVFLPGESHGRRRSPVGHSSWGRKESDTTEWLSATAQWGRY